MSTIEERLDKVRELIQDDDFLESKGLSNEVNNRKMKWLSVSSLRR